MHYPTSRSLASPSSRQSSIQRVTTAPPLTRIHLTSLAALGPTAPEIDLQALADLHVATIEKYLFSMMVPEVKALLQERPHVTSVVLFGIEVCLLTPSMSPLISVQSHVCVLQTALDLIQGGYSVHVLADGVSSCNKEEVPIALAYIRQAGGHITTSESAAFLLQRQKRLVKSGPPC